MLINITLLVGEIRKSSLLALQIGTDTHKVSDEEFAGLEKLCKSLKDVQIILEQLPDIVVQVEGDEYFTMAL